MSEQKRLDGPELREKLPILMRDMPCSKYKCDFWDVQGHYCFLSIDDKDVDCPMTREVQALIPDIEEAKKQERERILAWGIEVCPHWSGRQTKEVGVIKRDCSLCWQDLKETEGEK